jgi:hypothetical protein
MNSIPIQIFKFENFIHDPFLFLFFYSFEMYKLKIVHINCYYE